MKKTLIAISLLFSLSAVAQIRDEATKIMESIDKSYCTTQDGKPGTLKKTGMTESTSYSNSSNYNNTNNTSSSSQVSTGGRAGTSGVEVNYNTGYSSGKGSSNSQGGGKSSTTTQTTSYGCFERKY